jgi:hypothetical protein
VSWGDLIEGAVYVAIAPRTPYAKIGVTFPRCEADAAEAVRVRLRKLQRGCPLELRLGAYVYVEDAPGVEAELLRQFSRYRLFGSEWVKVARPGRVLHALRQLTK